MVTSSNDSGEQRTAIVSAKISQFFDRDVAAFVARLDRISREIDPSAPPVDANVFEQVRSAIQDSIDSCRRLEEDLSGADRDVIVDVQTRFRKSIEHFFHQSWIAHRAQTKPTGFPGDCQMLAALYNGQHLRTGIGGYIDAFIFTLPLAVAVRHRMQAAKEFLTKELAGREGGVRILDIASGPAREFVGWTALPSDGSVSITCMDNDPAALQFVGDTVQPTLCRGAEMQLVRYNALRTKSHTATIRNFGDFDIIYSVGLADYIPDGPLIAMLEGWRRTLKDGGVMYVGFKDCERYDKTPYQWHLDWHFLQRTETDCRELLDAAGYDSSLMHVDRDRSGIIINFFCPAPERAIVRVDSEHLSQAPLAVPIASHASIDVSTPRTL